jgi:hypothetical protein
MNTLNKLPLGMDFTAGGLNQLSNHPLRIYSAHVLQCMNVNNECFDICNTGTQVSPKKDLTILHLFSKIFCSISWLRVQQHCYPQFHTPIFKTCKGVSTNWCGFSALQILKLR